MIRLFVLAAAALFAAGCARYHIGFIGHPQLQTIGVGTIDNHSRNPQAATTLRMKLPAAFMDDGTMQVVPIDEADAVVHLDITNIELTTKGSTKVEDGDDSQQIYRSSIYGVRAFVTWYVVYRRTGERIIPKHNTIGHATFTEEIDLARTRQQAVDVALADAARKIADGIGEAW